MLNFNQVLDVVRGSKQYKFKGSVLTVTGYYSGDTFKLDLSKLDPEMLEALQPDEEDEEDY